MPSQGTSAASMGTVGKGLRLGINTCRQQTDMLGLDRVSVEAAVQSAEGPLLPLTSTGGFQLFPDLRLGNQAGLQRAC